MYSKIKSISLIKKKRYNNNEIELSNDFKIEENLIDINSNYINDDILLDQKEKKMKQIIIVEKLKEKKKYLIKIHEFFLNYTSMILFLTIFTLKNVAYQKSKKL